MVTGGTLLDGRKIAEHEIRGTQLNGDEAQNLAPGDVIVVPAGVPHWFKEVQAPFLYYTVKVSRRTAGFLTDRTEEERCKKGRQGFRVLSSVMSASPSVWRQQI